jgi:DNA repair protein RecO (recombination protein O)
MPAQSSEAIVLRTFPLKEADLIVSYFTRDLGKLRGVAKRARRPKSPFGAGLQRLSYVRMYYQHRENRELDFLDSCEILSSPFSMVSDYDVSVALDFLTEASEHLLPAGEPNERFFRLILAVRNYLDEAGAEGVWAAVTYFALWSARLGGFLGPMDLSEDEQAIGEEMLKVKLGDLTPRVWRRETAAGLRRQLVHSIEEHVERRITTLQYLG